MSTKRICKLLLNEYAMKINKFSNTYYQHFVPCCAVDEIGFEPVTVESLRADKVFVKLVKKQQKELESVNKMHVKERSTLQKQQCTVMDKMIAVHDKEKQQVEKVTEKSGKKKRYKS